MVDSENRKLIIRGDRRSKAGVLLYGILFSLLLFFLTLIKPTLTDFLHYRYYDLLLSANRGESSTIPVIVDIDEKSLKQYGQWPWPRYRIATLIDKLRNLGALSIGLDMLFAEEDRASIHSIRKELSRDFGVKLDFREVPQGLRDNDERLAKALLEGSVILGYQFLFDEGSDSETCLLHPIRVNELGNEGAEINSRPFLQAQGVSCNLKIFSQAAAGSGFFNISPETDGIVRRVPLIMEHRGKLYPSLALGTLMKALGVNDVLLKTDRNGVDSLYLNQTTIPLTSTGSLLIRFRGKGKTFDYVSAADILSDRIPDGKIHGKIVFVGTSASGLKELKSTPFDPVFPGVEVHATVVDNILKKDFIFRPRWAAGLESLGVLVIGLISALILAWTGAGWGSLLLGVAGVGVWQASVWMFRNEGIFISPVLPLIVLVCNFSILTFIRFWQEERRVKERTRELAMVQEATIESMSSLTETRDPHTGEHIRRTQNYIRLLADYLKKQPRFRPFLDDETINLLCKSAPLHDIGKVGVSDRILLKPGRLTDQEFEEMKQHTIYGRDTILAAERKLGNTSFLRVAREIAYTHHERWDGSGYPEGLKGEQIPVPGRLMALADSYDALTSKRVYKSEIPHEKAVEIIVGEKGSHFDPEVVDAFLQVKESFRQISLKYADT
ncbi:MAG TPA: CHASE2 domain-containing protein [Thermodesulfobacteriota bacterium]|nr:CHASE2 domain-containing protein [Thermodesulfobacteriota bacterium]